MRRFYFGLTALWGCIAGTAAIALAQSVRGAPLRPDLLLIVTALVGSVVAVGGGLVGAAAYREARRRRR